MPSLLKKKADVVLSELKKAENVENARKEHVLATYDFNCKLGRRILRFEGTNEFGVDIYYDYNTKKTGSLDVLAKYLGASNLRTDKIDLEKGQAVAPEAAPQKEPEVQAPLRTPNEFTSSKQSETPGDSTPQQSNDRVRSPLNQSEPPKSSIEASKPKNPQRPRRAQHKASQPRRTDLGGGASGQPGSAQPSPSLVVGGRQHATQQGQGEKTPAPPIRAPPKKMLGKPEAKLGYTNILPGQSIPPAGAPIKNSTKYDFTYFRTVKFGPLFGYYNFFPETIHCASYAIGAAFSAVAIKNERCNTFMPVSSWELAAQMKLPEYLKMFKPLAPAIKSDADLLKFMADADNKLPAGTLLTLRAVGTAHTEIPADTPTHTLVYMGSGQWTDNVDDEAPRNFFMRGNGVNKVWQDWISAFPKYFKYVENSGAYAPVFENFPRAAERKISLSDFKLSSETPENFALLLSQTYHMPYEIIFNSIMNQNKLADPRGKVPNLSVQLFIPEIQVGKQLKAPINWANAPTRKKVASTANEASFSPLEIINVYDKLKQSSTDSRIGVFVEQCKEIDRLAPKLGVDPKDMDALKVILFNEYYSSSGLASGRLLKKKIVANTGHLDQLNSYGVYQYNINSALKFLSNKKDREAFIELFRGLGRLGAEQTKSLRNFDGLNKEEKRNFVAKELLTDLGVGLFFANKLYQQNKSIVADNARISPGRKFGQGESAFDLEFTSVFSYNRGSESTNSAIFQQNLLITAENMLGQARFSKYHDQINWLLDGYKIDGGIAVKGRGGEYEPSKTYELFKVVCEAYGVREISANGRKYAAQAMSPGDLVAVFGKNYSTTGPGGKKIIINNYWKMSEFFSLNAFAPPQPKKKDEPVQSTVLEQVRAGSSDGTPMIYAPGVQPSGPQDSAPNPFMQARAPPEDKPPISTKPCLDFDYLRARKNHLTGYLTNYLAFVPAP